MRTAGALCVLCVSPVRRHCVSRVTCSASRVGRRGSRGSIYISRVNEQYIPSLTSPPFFTIFFFLRASLIFPSWLALKK